MLLKVNPEKDVDGFHPVNVGKMVVREKCFLPCTPHGILELLARSGVQTEGAEVVVVGRSNIVGKPILNLMLQKRPTGNATVTLCHTRTKDTAFHTKRADILIVATGHPKTVTGDMVKEGSVVIDVGINRITKEKASPELLEWRKEDFETKGATLIGDVDFLRVESKVSYITPVPGGVGPMTIAMLLANTLKASKQIAGLK